MNSSLLPKPSSTRLACVLAASVLAGSSIARADDAATPAPVPAPIPAPAPSKPASDPLTVTVLTFAPGDHPFYKFGHNAIWIHDESRPLRPPPGQRGRDRVYNYGTFSFGDPALIPKFFLGRFQYWLSSQTLQTTLLTYKAERRTVEAQELDLEPAAKAELLRLLEENLKPENRHYKYDYYRDNCATRVRDMIDKVTSGAYHAATSGPARLNFRQHTQRVTADLPSEYVVLDLMMGDLIDKPITEWDEGFLPMEVQRSLRKVKLPGPDGALRPIVKSERTLLDMPKPPPPEEPPRAWPYGLAAGLPLGALFAALGTLGARSTSAAATVAGVEGAPGARPARIAFGVALSLVGLVAGFVGVVSVLLGLVTDHAVGYRNENLLLAVPWAIVLVGTGINVARARARSMLSAERLVGAALATSALGLVCKALPWFDQDNRLFLAFFLPLWAGAFYGSKRLADRARAALATTSAPPANATPPASSAVG